MSSAMDTISLNAVDMSPCLCFYPCFFMPSSSFATWFICLLLFHVISPSHDIFVECEICWRCTPICLLLTGTYIDKKCPFTGTVSIRGRILAGTCHSAKMVRTIIVRRNYLHWVKKYQRSSPILVLVFFSAYYHTIII